VRTDTITSIKNQKEALSDLNIEIADLRNRYRDAGNAAKNSAEGTWANSSAVAAAEELENELNKKLRDRDTQQRTLNKTQDAYRLINIQVNQGIVDQMKAARDGAIALAEAEKKTSLLGGSQALLAEKLGLSTTALQKFNAESLKINWGGSDGEKLIKQAERRLALSKLEGEAKARLQATYDAQDAGTTDPLAIKRLQDMYAETERVTQGRKDQKKEDKSAAAEGKKLENQQESIAQKLANLKQQSEMAADSTKELSREQAILTAQQSLGSSATQKDIALAGQYAAAKWDTANAIRAQAAAEKLLPETRENASYKQDVADLQTALSAKKISQEQFNATSEQLEQQHQAALAQIRANQAITPQQEAAGTVDPVQALANENAKKLALIQQFEANKTLTEQQGIALRNAANTVYEKQRTDAMWELYRNQSVTNELMASAVDGFASQAASSLTGLIDGTQSASEAFQNLGTSIINSVIQALVEVGIQYLKNAAMAMIADKMQANSSSTAATQTATAWAPAAAAASIATFGGAAVAGIAGMVAAYGVGIALAGKRKNGGPVSAGGMYQVGEGGMPEIYQSSSGRQYMIPGDNGSVISNKDMQSGSGGSSSGITVIIQNMSSNAGVQDYQTSKDQSGNDVLQIAIADINNGGALSQAISNNHQAPRRATQ
jgi:hypothetical protein